MERRQHASDESLGHGTRVAVIVPAYRAAGAIEKVLSGIPSWVNVIYVVDDASPDGTGARVRAQADSRVQLLVHDVNRGVGGAMVTGYRRALAEGVDICVKMDADDQMDPALLGALIEPLASGRADYAKGNRFRDAEALRRMPLGRKIGNAGLSFLIKAASGQWHIFDPTNGYVAIHRAVLAGLDLRKVHPRYFFESSMLILLRRLDAVVEDVPMPARYGDESSHLSIGRTLIEFPWLLLRYGLRRVLWQYFIADFNAVSLLLLSGVPLVTFGGVFGLYHWIDNYRHHVLTPTGTVMLAVLPLILGFQLLLQALVLDVQNVPRRPFQTWLRAPFTRPLRRAADHASPDS
jgi:glycosyltransferase involved in cell wall biosynthesis